ncbi:hypothetical protein EVAR_24026_1 [Eumeta japonica]|uniref:Uncharacterized protein n=1 Tax=Eumeta variegata TaxID=151549 RepID=A0A4C1WCB9_EUMVA|nr:hypothetical protein EVAR_24026_1 [Eumeta japonica]
MQRGATAVRAQSDALNKLYAAARAAPAAHLPSLSRILRHKELVNSVYIQVYSKSIGLRELFTIEQIELTGRRRAAAGGGGAGAPHLRALSAPAARCERDGSATAALLWPALRIYDMRACWIPMRRRARVTSGRLGTCNAFVLSVSV